MINRNLRRFFKIRFTNFPKINLNKKFLMVTAVTAGFIVFTLPPFLRWMFPAVVGWRPISRFELWSRLESTSGKQVLSDMVNESILTREINKRGVKIDEMKYKQELDRMTKQMGNRVPKEVLEDQIRNQMHLEQILDDKLSVSNEEIKLFFVDKAKTTYKNKNIDEVREEIEKLIKQQKLQAAFEVWFAELKSQTRVTNFGL